MMKEILFVMLGGGAGSIFRFLVSEFSAKPKNGFPLGTFIVNLIGCFLLGLVSGYFTAHSELYLLLGTGFCGGFTTFSTFSKETFLLFHNKQHLLAVNYVVLSCVCGVSLFMSAYFLSSTVLV